jgi:hypothetical protein
MQLRFLDSMRDVATDKNATLVLPIPIDLLSGFVRRSS